MDKTAQERSPQPEGKRHPGSPEGKIFGAVQPENVEALVAALKAAGYDDDQIDIVTSDHLDDVDAPFRRSGLLGLVNRFLFSLGAELDEFEKFRQELSGGHCLVGVPVADHEATLRIAAIMREHGGHRLSHFGRWTITDLEG